jgi:hypothetical protein
MRYTVVWKPAAEIQLAAIWNSSSIRSAVTKAADSIDSALRNDPVLRGESYTRATRVLLEWPLVITYRVFEKDRLVRVLTVEPLPQSEASE